MLMMVPGSGDLMAPGLLVLGVAAGLDVTLFSLSWAPVLVLPDCDSAGFLFTLDAAGRSISTL